MKLKMVLPQRKKKRNHILRRQNIFKKEENSENTFTKNIDNQIFEMVLIILLFLGLLKN